MPLTLAPGVQQYTVPTGLQASMNIKPGSDEEKILQQVLEAELAKKKGG
jgi:hypothetical protein